MSSTIASSILRKFSACRSSLDENGMALILVTPSTTCATSGPKSSSDPLDRGQRVLDDVVEQAGGDRHGVELHVGEEVGDRERVDEVGLPGMADLSLVLEGREHVGPPEQLDVGVRGCRPGLFRGDPRSESWKSVSNHLIGHGSSRRDSCRRSRGRLGPAWRLDDSLTYDFLLHYTDPVSGSAILCCFRGLQCDLCRERRWRASAMLALGSLIGWVRQGRRDARPRRRSRRPTRPTRQQDYKKAAELYEETIAADPNLNAGLLLPRQQLRQPVQAEQEGRAGQRRVARQGRRELSDGGREALRVGERRTTRSSASCRSSTWSLPTARTS